MGCLEKFGAGRCFSLILFLCVTKYHSLCNLYETNTCLLFEFYSKITLSYVYTFFPHVCMYTTWHVWCPQRLSVLLEQELQVLVAAV